MGSRGRIGGLLCNWSMYPGVIAVNTATFIGQKQAGILGGIIATIGVVFPSLMQLIKRVVLFYVCDDALKSGDLSGADFVKQEHKEIQGEVLC